MTRGEEDRVAGVLACVDGGCVVCTGSAAEAMVDLFSDHPWTEMVAKKRSWRSVLTDQNPSHRSRHRWAREADRGRAQRRPRIVTSQALLFWFDQLLGEQMKYVAALAASMALALPALAVAAPVQVASNVEVQKIQHVQLQRFLRHTHERSARGNCHLADIYWSCRITSSHYGKTYVITKKNGVASAHYGRYYVR